MGRLVLCMVICLGLLSSPVFGERNIQGPDTGLKQKTILKVKKASPDKFDKKVLGKWRSTNMRDEFPFYGINEYTEAPAKIKKVMLPPAPVAQDNTKKWVRVKGVEDPSKKMNPALKPYSVYVPRVGYSLLSFSKRIINNVETDVVELGCKIEIENKTSRAVHAYGGCYLYDEHLFPLADSNIAKWDQNETGIMVPAHGKAAIMRSSNWVIEKKAKPYPTSRIRNIDYELFLRHDDM